MGGGIGEGGLLVGPGQGEVEGSLAGLARRGGGGGGGGGGGWLGGPGQGEVEGSLAGLARSGESLEVH